MINPKEIRIGNTLYDRHGNIIHVHAGWFYLTQDPKRLSDYAPIPLTPKILEKCGFEKSDKNQWYQFYDKENIRVFLHHSLNSVFVAIDGLKIDCYTNNFYLHQLQNFYHALTGEELEINELANFTTY